MSAASIATAIRSQSDERTRPVSPGGLLVATDGSEAADSAFFLAAAISRCTGVGVQVLAVIEPLPVVSPEVQMAETQEMLNERRRIVRETTREQMHRVLRDQSWTIDVEVGSPGLTIARVAREMEASLIVVGLGRHGTMDLLFGDETALQLLRMGPVPVLAAGPAAVGLPSRVIIATDFSQASLRAAQRAMAILPRESTVFLTHVVSGDLDETVWQAWQPAYNGLLGQAFDRFEARLEKPLGTRAERVILHGDAARALLEFSNRVHADLIVAGTHGHGFFSRLLLGSVSTRLVRGAGCSVLVAPRLPGDEDDFAHRAQRVEQSRFQLYEWAERLEEFTRRNAGRSVSIELDDVELGAQAQGSGLPLLGAAYDHRDARVEIMLGDRERFGGQITHSIGDVIAMDLLRDAGGKDLVLRIAHGRGQTLLTLER